MQTLPNRRSKISNQTLQSSMHDNTSMVNGNYAEANYPINHDTLRLSQTDRLTLSNMSGNVQNTGTLPAIAKTATLTRNGKVSRPPSAIPSEKIYQKPKTIFDSVDSLDQPWYRTTTNTLKNNPSSPIYTESKRFTYDCNSDNEKKRLLGTKKKAAYHGSEDERRMPSSTTDEESFRGSTRNYKKNKRNANNNRQSCFNNGVESSDRKSYEDYRNREYDSSCRGNTAAFCITLFVIIDFVLIGLLALFAFILRCSTDSYFYRVDFAQGICHQVWKSLIPFYKRKFVCPVPPTAYFSLENEIPKFENNNNNLQSKYNSDPYGSNNGFTMDVKKTPTEEYLRYDNFMINFTSTYSKSIYWPLKLPWDSDIGFGHPPSYFSVGSILDQPATTDEILRFQARSYSHKLREPFDIFHNKDTFMNTINYNEDWKFPVLTEDAVILFSILIPLTIILLGEIFVLCLVPSTLLRKKLKNRLCFTIPQTIRRILRFFIIYTGGLIVTLCTAEILKIFFGRLRPDFINICKPRQEACPFWYQQEELISKRKRIISAKLNRDPLTELNIKNEILSETWRSMNLLLSKQKNERFIDRNMDDRDSNNKPFVTRMFGLDYCTEKNILNLKKASTSFPSTSCAVAFYSLTFVAIYLHGLGSIHKAKILAIPVFNIGLFLVTLVLVPMGRVAHRMNWVDDVVYGSIIGFLISVYICIFILRRFKFKEHISQRRIMRKLA